MPVPCMIPVRLVYGEGGQVLRSNSQRGGAPVIDESTIGRRVRDYRKAKGLTLQEMADATGFSKGYLSKLETSKKAPPLSTLSRIGKVLGVTTSTLLGETGTQSSISFVKRTERIPITHEGTAFGYSYQSIAYRFPERHMQPFILILPPRPLKPKALFQHDSEELLFVLQGVMRFYYGDQVFIVEEGDCVYFDGNVPHYGESFGDHETVCLMVLHSK